MSTSTPTHPLDPKGEAGSKKTPLWLFPPIATAEGSKALKTGAAKYGAFNWRTANVCASTYISAIMRHLDAYRNGADLDPDSGVSHLGHLIANLAILLDAEQAGTLVDDRNKLVGKPVLTAKGLPVNEPIEIPSEDEASAGVKGRPTGLPKTPCDISSVPEGFAYLGQGGKTAWFSQDISTKDFVSAENADVSWHGATGFRGDSIWGHYAVKLGSPTAMKLGILEDCTPTGDGEAILLPGELLPLPKLPEGKEKWVLVNRDGESPTDPNRKTHAAWWNDDWRKTRAVDTSHWHIEAL